MMTNPQPDPMAAYRPAYIAPPPRETGSTFADGMAAIAYVVGNLAVCSAEFELSDRQLAAALHVGPVATAYRDDESETARENITRALRNIAARHRRQLAAAMAPRPQDARPAAQDAPSATNGSPGGPRVPVPPPPPTQPPVPDRAVFVWPDKTAPTPAPRTYVPQDAERIAF